MKRAVLLALRIALPAGLFVYLLWTVSPEDYRVFWNQPKRWGLLLAAQAIALLAITISFMRWFALVRAIDIPFTPREALRLGFIGYLLNFVSFGSVGGDLFKAILVARDKPEKRPEAVASVLLDRAIGLLGLVILAWFSLQLASESSLSLVLLGIRRAAGSIALVSLAALVAAIWAGAWFDRWIEQFARIPWLGPIVVRMAQAVRLLRRSPLVLLVLLGLAIAVHSLLALTVYLISCGVYREQPSFAQHLMVVPPGMAAGALPLAPGGIGLQEGALKELFDQLPNLPSNFSGMLVATVYRLITIAISGIGLVYYWLSHGREFRLASLEK